LPVETRLCRASQAVRLKPVGLRKTQARVTSWGCSRALLRWVGSGRHWASFKFQEDRASGWSATIMSEEGDHRHYGSREEPYAFETVEKLVADFLRDMDELRGEGHD